MRGWHRTTVDAAADGQGGWIRVLPDGGQANYAQASIVMDATFEDAIFTLPPASEFLGRSYWFKRIDVPGTMFECLVLPDSTADTIEGAASYSLTTQWASLVLISDGVSTWLIQSEILEMSGIADYIAVVLAEPNLRNFWDTQDASYPLIDSGPDGDDIPGGTGTVHFQEPGPADAVSIRADPAGGIAQFGGTLTWSPGANDPFAYEFWFHQDGNAGWGAGFATPFVTNPTYQPIQSGSAPGFGQPANRFGLIQQGVGFFWTGATLPIADATWYSAVLQRQASSNVWEFWIDGVHVYDITFTAAAITHNDLEILKGFFNGSVTCVSIYDDVLSPTSIAAHNAAMVGGPPVNSVPPALSGAAVEGHTLTTDDGTWVGASSFTYQWEFSADGSTGWTPIGGETAATYDVVGGDIGTWLRCVVSAHNVDGDADEPSNVIGPVIAASTGPVVVGASSGANVDAFSTNTYTPDTSGVLAGDYMIVSVEAAFTAAAGITAPDGWELLETGTPGGSALMNVYGKLTYEDTPTETFTFASNAAYCGTMVAARGGFDPAAPIGESGRNNDQTLATVTYDDQDLVLAITLGHNGAGLVDTSVIPVGFTDVIKQRVTSGPSVVGWMVDNAKLEATGSGTTAGLSFTYSAGTPIYTYVAEITFNPGDIPVNVDPPVIGGEVAVNGTVDVTDDGTWTFTPTSFTYQWQISDDGSTGWSNLSGETASSLLIDFGEATKFLRCLVTAHNPAGASAPTPSNVLGPVEPYPTVRYFTAIA